MSNLHFNFDDWINARNDLKTKGCCSGRFENKPFINLNYSNSNEVCLVFYEYCGNSRRNNTTIRDLTSDEIDEILQIAEDLKKDYIERLKKYYNKYGMSCCGYWVNRQEELKMKIQKINKNLLDTYYKNKILYYQKLDDVCYVTDSYIAYKLPANEFMLDPEKLKK